MRILTICGNLERGGTQRAAQSYSQAYHRAGHDVLVWGWHGGGVREDHLRNAGIAVIVGDDAFPQVEAFDPQIIHIHRPGPADESWNNLLRKLKRDHRRILETNVFSRVDYSEGSDLIDVHLHLSEWCLWKWRSAMGKQSRDRAAVVVPYPVDANQFQRSPDDQRAAFRSKLGIPSDSFVCGRVGQTQPAKWHPSNLLAFVSLADKDRSAHLVLRGVPEYFKAMLDSLRPSIRSRIHLLSLTDSDQEMSDLYSSLDCFLHAAHIGESFGMVLAEAMLCGCPVVTVSRPFKDNSQVEVVGHLKGGVVAGSMKSLASALHSFRFDLEVRQRLQPDLRHWVLSRYDADQVTSQAIRVAEHALAAPSRKKLVKSLENDSQLVSHVDGKRIEQLLYDTFEGPAWVDLLKMRLVHQPWVQRMIQAVLRRWVHRARS